MNRVSSQSKRSSLQTMLTFQYGLDRIVAGLAVDNKNDASTEEVCKRAAQMLSGTLEGNSFQIDHDPLGRPFLVGESGSTFGISISRSEENVAVLCFPKLFPMGLDLEKVQLARAKVAASILSPHETRLLKGAGLDEERGGLLAWTAKESAAKMLGTGFKISVEQFEIKSLSLDSRGHWKSSFCKLPDMDTHSWFGQGHVFSIAASSMLRLEGGLSPGLVSPF